MQQFDGQTQSIEKFDTSVCIAAPRAVLTQATAAFRTKAKDGAPLVPTEVTSAEARHGAALAPIRFPLRRRESRAGQTQNRSQAARPTPLAREPQSSQPVADIRRVAGWRLRPRFLRCAPCPESSRILHLRAASPIAAMSLVLSPIICFWNLRSSEKSPDAARTRSASGCRPCR